MASSNRGVPRLYAADPRLLQRIEPHVRRVLVVDPTPVAARLIGEFLRALGSREVMHEAEERRALDLAQTLDPQVIFIEATGPKLDGESFTRRLRRSRMACRAAPVIMTTRDATAATIRGARDAGVNEFLRKPFTAGDFLKRVAIVTLKPREWIEAVGYVGPDRRRFNSGDYSGPLKRRDDDPADEGDVELKMIDQASKILRSAIVQFDTDPTQAVRAMSAQVKLLKAHGETTANVQLLVALTGLDIALKSPNVTRADLVHPVRTVLAIVAPNLVAASLRETDPSSTRLAR